MSELKATPGPWDLEAGIDGIVWVDGPATSICDLYHTGGKGEFVVKPNAIANARLIAAAPELYEACQAALNMVDTDQGPPNWDLLRAALRKARGEP